MNGKRSIQFPETDYYSIIPFITRITGAVLLFDGPELFVENRANIDRTDGWLWISVCEFLEMQK